MLATNLKVAAIVIGTLVVYTALANMIPQVASAVPEELELSGEFNVDELTAAGEEIYGGAGGCTACHGLGTRAPNLLTDEGGTGLIGERCASRVPGQDCKTYLYESMVDPSKHLVAGYQPIMPDMTRMLSPAQIWAVVAYLQRQGGEVTVGPDDVASEEPETGPGAAPVTEAQGVQTATASLEPIEIMRANQCLLCHKLGAEGGPIGPSFDGMGARVAADRIRRGIVAPNEETAAGYEALAGTMPQTFGQQLTAAQLEALVAFLSARK